MDYKNLDAKWNEYWAKNHLHAFDNKNTDNKYYVLEMFSYPSGSNLHLGHWYNYGPSDSFARFKRMQGFDVFQPMGFDAFGLPAENFAIKTGIHPKESTLKNIKTMERQLSEIGAMYAENSSLYTCSPEYYKWTQWLFIKLYEKGLAYQKEASVNWCSSCNTVIANEQVLDGVCERCKTTVVKKEMVQWFFKITDYAEELLSGLDTIDWPEKTKAMQRNWIGKSTGVEIEFKIKNSEDSLRVFTTRADTLMGVSYVVLAPEHKLVSHITTKAQAKAIKDYQEETAKSSEIDRLSSVKEKTGVFTGAYCLHPITNKELPIYIADYCLASYGTGAVMAVPAHDTRDFDFAKKYNLPINRVIDPTNAQENNDLPFTEHGKLVNSDNFNGLSSLDAIDKIAEFLEKQNSGEKKINYRLRDWSVSRQRYWGAPIPIIYCDDCGTVPVPEKDLPVELPDNVNFTPDGKSPLSKSKDFYEVKCPKCGKKARREVDTLDTFVCSSWYYLRYPNANNKKEAFDKELINKMLPVDKYIGGAEHACMHLLYSRFITKALRDMDYLKFSEPFTSLVHQGLILGPDGNKMSKNLGNVINPDIYVNEHGSDIFRMYLMFGFSYIEGGPWNDDGIKAIVRFIDRVVRLVEKYKDIKLINVDTLGKDEKELEFALNYCIKNASADFENFSFNTSIARIMELVNAIYKYEGLTNLNTKLIRSVVSDLVLLLAPIVPHIAEELHAMLGNKKSVFLSKYPTFNESKLIKDEVEIAIQINSKVRHRLNIPSTSNDKEVENIVLADEKIKELLNGATPKKVIIIKGRLVNIIV